MKPKDLPETVRFKGLRNIAPILEVILKHLMNQIELKTIRLCELRTDFQPLFMGIKRPEYCSFDSELGCSVKTLLFIILQIGLLVTLPLLQLS